MREAYCIRIYVRQKETEVWQKIEERIVPYTNQIEFDIGENKKYSQWKITWLPAEDY